MASVMGDFVCATRQFFSQGFRSLPAILGGASLTLGMIQGNFNFLFFFVGMFIFTPVAAGLLNGLLELIFVNVPIINQFPREFWSVPNGTANACSIFTVGLTGGPPQPINVVPSYWMSIMTFFFAYIFCNALFLYKKQENEKAKKEGVTARKSQALISMIVAVMVGIGFSILRYATSCETMFGILISWGLGIGMAIGWYKFMRVCGLGRLDDLFGISSRILPLQSYEEITPTVCVPS